MGWKKSGFEEAMMSRKHVTPKITRVKPGVKISDDEWPSDYLPTKIVADRGEMMRMKADAIINNVFLKDLELCRYDTAPAYITKGKTPRK